MSLTSELRRPDSPISKFFARELPEAAELAARYGRWAEQLRKPLRPRTRGEIDWPMLGHTIDHRIRVSSGSPYGPPIRSGVNLSGLSGLAALHDGAGQAPAVSGAIRQAGQQMLEELTARTSTPPPLDLSGTDGERLIRLCHLASHFEVIFRSGTLQGVLADATADTTLESLLASVPEYAIADIRAQLRLAADPEALGWLAGREAACGPEFPGSDHVGGADADVIVDGELIDCKATVKPTNLGVREIYQLAGYLLLDYDDRYRIRVLSLYLSRQGALIGWSVPEFLAVLGATKQLAELRQALADELTTAAARA
ncbi:hypothetical protein ACFQ0M_48695 [Kitasatospora aburaviensis]|uniref:Restriction endonuclease n=1 Tax=Kitasatospora aburaviensis TaxID=67265 RepID=A0ABW1F494_9ACTN